MSELMNNREREGESEEKSGSLGGKRVGTDLFLLNSSRLNQQIIDLIK